MKITYLPYLPKKIQEPEWNEQLFGFLASAFILQPSFFQPFISKCFCALKHHIAAGRDSEDTALRALGMPTHTQQLHTSHFNKTIGKAFRSLDFTQKQISAFMSLALGQGSEELAFPIGTVLGMCGLRHAAFMTDMDPELHDKIFAVEPDDILQTSDEVSEDIFLQGVCNLWEALLPA